VSGQTVNESTALNVGAVWTGVAIRSRLLAALPVDVLEKIDARSSRDAVNHPLRRVLLQPNSWQTRFELFAMLEIHRLLRGNAYAWINRVTGMSGDGIERDQVAELVPMHPDRVEVVDPDDFTGPTAYRLKKRNGQVIPLAASEVLHLKSISTDGRTGRSFLQDMREVIGGAWRRRNTRTACGVATRRRASRCVIRRPSATRRRRTSRTRSKRRTAAAATRSGSP
jgi:HK97 family phage portal protein